MSTTLPFGTWPSAISAADLAAHSPRLGFARFVGDDVWWDESVAAENGRTAIFSRATSAALLPAPWSARSRVHEYGGLSWTVTADGDLLFVEQSDQRIYRMPLGGDPQPLTPEADDCRYGDLYRDNDTLWAVRERAVPGSSPVRDIVWLPVDGSNSPVSAVSGSDFLAYPRPRGGRLAWTAWNHPDMPWDASEVRVGELSAQGTVSSWTPLAGGRSSGPRGENVSALAPLWLSDTEVLLTSDEPIDALPGAPTRWNLGVFSATNATPSRAVHPVDADIGGPLWMLGTQWFLALNDGAVLAVETNGRDRLVLIPADGGDAIELEIPLHEMTLLDHCGDRVLLAGAGASTPGGIWELDVSAHTIAAVRGGEHDLDPAWLSTAQPLTVRGPHGDVHAFAYPPTHPEISGPDGVAPPYVVLAHGGPTGHVAGTVSLKISYLTSRGIGVLDVNYGGSSGYGRTYRERLLGQWGVVDVDDVVAAAVGFADAGLADPARLAVNGGSAGGWTVLCALANSDIFSAGIDRYGVADLRALVAETHDFESRYLDGLVGPLPDCEDTYISRSPLSHTQDLTAPMLILQGSDDQVVPPAQSRRLRDALAAGGVPHRYIEFAGEGHGFRGTTAIITVAESEVAFLGAVWGFAPHDFPPLALTTVSDTKDTL